MTTLSEPNLADVLFAADRDAAIAELAAAGPVLPGRYLDGSMVWLVTGYEESLAVLNDRRFSNDPTRSGSVDIGAAFPDDVRPYLLQTLGTNDPPDHTRLRRLVSAQFTARRVQSLRGRITEITDELLNDLDGATGEIDLIERFAYPLPIRVICELLGVPAVDRDRWRRWSTDLSASDPDRMVAGARGLIGYISQLVEAKRHAPGDDLLSALVAAHEADHDKLGTDELISVAITILVAGHETTVNLLANAVLVLLTCPERAQALRRDPDAIPRAVEELLRYCGPADIAVLRYPTEPVTLGGQLISPGEPVQIVYAAANRDPRRFTTPTGPTWPATTTHTSGWATASTTASAPHSPAQRPTSPCTGCSPATPTSPSPRPPPTSAGSPASPAGSADCPSTPARLPPPVRS